MVIFQYMILFLSSLGCLPWKKEVMIGLNIDEEQEA